MATVMRRVAFKGSTLVGVTLVGTAYYQRLPQEHGDHRSAPSEGAATRVYRTFVAPLVMCIDPETAHNLALRMARVWQGVRVLAEPTQAGSTPLDWLLRPGRFTTASTGPVLSQNLFDGKLNFKSPFGIAAGFDKNALLVPLYRLECIPGLGFSEVGSVSALPSLGNPQPRCWRVPTDEAVINFMGLNNEGAASIAERLEGFAAFGRAGLPTASGPSRAPVGVNIAKTHSQEIYGEAAIEDFMSSFRTLAPHADFVVLNVSCPNTAEGKTFEDPTALRDLLEAVAKERTHLTGAAQLAPVLVKLHAPPNTEAGHGKLCNLLDVIKSSGIVDGIVMSNTVPDREVPLSADGQLAAAAPGVRGGLSGVPLQERSTAAIRTIYKATGGCLPIIGVGGVDSPEEAYTKIRAGASLIELYTGIVYKGPGVFSDLHVGLRRLLERDGFHSVAEAVGADAVRMV